MSISEGRIILIGKLSELQEIKEKYSNYPQDETIGEEGYTYKDHVNYLQAKQDSIVWAIEVLLDAENNSK